MAGAPKAASVPAASRAGIWGWIFFDWAQQPFFTLVTTFIFAPYFAARVAEDPASGQAMWGWAAGAAGLVIALLSPPLGAVADAGGRRKVWIGFFSALMIAGCFGLWLAEPDGAAPVLIVLAAFVLASIGAEFGIVFNNAMMPDLVPRNRLGRLSGTGWAMGYAGGLVALALTLALLAADPVSGRTFLGLEPVFGMDAARGEGERATGPLSALWFLVFALPFFLFTPDTPRRAPFGQAMREGLAALADTLRHIRRHGQMVRFLIARMLYADGLAALFTFGGIYAAGTFGWGTTQLGIFGILLTVTGAFGAWAGGRLDDRFGPKPVIAASLVVLILAGAAVLTIDREHVLFVLPVAGAGEAGLFASTAERAYIALALLLGLAAGPVQAASRTLLVRLAPKGDLTQFFGLYALSGKITTFAAPMAVAFVTAATMSQRAGISVVLVFLIAGLALLVAVRVPKA